MRRVCCVKQYGISQFNALLNEYASQHNISLRRDRNPGDDVYEKRLRYLSRIPLLILDEWFACSPTKTELVFLHELIDSRYGRHATIVCSQMPSENWAQYCPNKALGESISGRILAHCYCIRLEGEDMCKTHFERP